MFYKNGPFLDVKFVQTIQPCYEYFNLEMLSD